MVICLQRSARNMALLICMSEMMGKYINIKKEKKMRIIFRSYFGGCYDIVDLVIGMSKKYRGLFDFADIYYPYRRYRVPVVIVKPCQVVDRRP